MFRDRFGVRDVSHVPTGVDTEYFRPSGQEQRRPHEIVFTGSMDWMPNEDAIKWFVQDILPLVRARVPDVTLTVVGRDPPASIRALAGDPAITVTGSVPDVRPYIERAAAFIVPIRIGGGTRLKIFEAMATGRAVVSTRVGAEGLDVMHNEDVILQDDPEPFADAVIEFLVNGAKRREFEQRAADTAARFDWSQVVSRFEGALEAGIASARRDPVVAAR